MTQPISLLICALGGEGGGTLAEWLVNVARHAGYPVQATSIPGVAQRTGATTYYLEFFPVPLASLGARRPVLGLNPLPGRLDALVSSELLETTRQIGNGLVSPDRTLVISHSGRTLTTAEKMVMGDGRRDTESLAPLVKAHARTHHLVDMATLTREAGTIVSAVMLGCIAASGLLPFGREHFEAVLAGEGASARASQKGFALGYAALGGDVTSTTATTLPAGVQGGGLPDDARIAQAAASGQALPPDVAADFPHETHDILALGYWRVHEFQGKAYAQVYLDRVGRVLAVERSQAGTRFAVTREVARWLALWMSFDDIFRVADLKSRASRMERVRREVRAGKDDLVKVYDFFKPGIPEIAGLLPQALGRRLLQWDRRRAEAGRSAWSLPLKVATHSLWGILVLRTLAAARVLRPLGSRFRAEQTHILHWLEGVIGSANHHPVLALEVARCGRLIKGYGSTNERGQANLRHILAYLSAQPTQDDNLAKAVARMREAALQDEAGQALDQVLREHGAAPRPVPEQPIRFVRRPRSS